MSLQDDIFEVDDAIIDLCRPEITEAFNNIIKIFNELETEVERLRYENRTLKGAIRIVRESKDDNPTKRDTSGHSG